MLGAMAAASARRPWRAVTVWLISVAAALIGAQTLGSGFEDDFELPGARSAQGLTVLEDAGADGQLVSAGVVINAEDGRLEDERAAVDEAVADVEDLPVVTGVTDPFERGGVMAESGATALLTLELATSPQDLSTAELDALDAAFDPARDAGIQVEYPDQLGRQMDADHGTRGAELLGLVAAFLVLLVIFRSVIGAAVPVACALLAVGLGLGLLGLSTAVLSFATASPALAMMIGLGTGVDYGLFLVTRFRQLVMDGVSPRAAAVHTARTSGHAVVVGAMTVALALLALYASGVPFVGQLGLAAVITVSTSALSALTLVPAAFGMFGRAMDRFTIFGAARAEPDLASVGGESSPAAGVRRRGGGWPSYARLVARHPWPFLVGATVLLGLLTAPVLAMETGPVDDGAGAESLTTRRAYDLIAEGFGPGSNGTFLIVLDASGMSSADAEAGAAAAESELREEPGVASVTPLSAVGDGSVWTGTLTPASAPQSQDTAELFERLEADVLPGAWDERWGEPGESYVTGLTPVRIEFGRLLGERLPLIIGLVVLASLVILTLSFRAPVLALKAAVLNVVSIGASYGVVVAVFQWQWGSGLIGIDRSVPIEPYVPMLMFVIVFGLSMDYEVFLLSRVREAWERTGSNLTAVAEGLAATARVITAAALIMTLVFLSFTLDDDVAVKMLAVGLAVSVVVDASIVRLVLVPSGMVLMGQANWWRPRWWRQPPANDGSPSGNLQEIASGRGGT